MTAAPETLAEANRALVAGTTTAVELTECAIERADQLDSQLGVFIARTTESARVAAELSDRRRRAGESLGPLDGIPIGLKDIVSDVEGQTTAQSLAHSPAWQETVGVSSVARRLRAAGAVVMGKLTTMEFATGLPDETKPFPTPRNPWDVDRWAGGSSSGSGSGVASGMFLGAVGTDTAGSIRIPSAFNGITGLKPTFGRVPKDGVVPLGFTLDHVGPMARTAEDCALMLEVMAGHSDSDPCAAHRPTESWSSALTGDLRGIRIGVDTWERHAAAGVDPDQPALFQRSLDVLRDAGATVTQLEVPMYAEAMAVDMIVMLSEAHAFHAPDLRGRWEDYGLATRVLLASADVLTGADYVQAQRVRRVLRTRVDGLFESVDLVVTPSGHLGAPLLSDLDPANALTALPSVHTPYWNPLGNPTIALPIGLSSVGTPLSMSISGRHWDERLVLRAADAVQRRTSEHLAKPPMTTAGALS
ncbi:amidase [Nocardioides sp. Soil797]|nr:amidase [Nocardioides sp. Soil797]